jgi:GNAT superfamily N-acetyltransferase
MDRFDRFCIQSGSFADLNEADMTACIEIVRTGGAVQLAKEAIRQNLWNVQLMANIREDGTGNIVAVGAIKANRPVYRAQQFRNANFPINGYEYAAEIGYVAVDKRFRKMGLSGAIMSQLMRAKKGKFFATTDDVNMKRTLKKASFDSVGSEWVGARAALSLWVSG